MDIKKKLLKKLVDTDEEIVYIVNHHPIVYFPLMIISILGVIILFFLYKFIFVFSEQVASYLCGILGLILYIYFLLNFFDIYLDAVALTSSTIIIYQWYWLFKTTTDVLDFHAVESVYADQLWLIDVIFNKWDIYIRRAGHTNVFDNVANPNKVANVINSMLSSLEKAEETNDTENDEKNNKEDKVKLLAEVLAEVISEMK